MKHLILSLLLVGSAALAQDYPLQKPITIDRPRPASAVLVGICEQRRQVLMVAIFTFPNGKVLLVDAHNMNGFTSVQEITQYAASAESVTERIQTCGDIAT